MSKSDEELDYAMAKNVMSWMPIDREAMGWGPGAVVWSIEGDPDQPESSPTFRDFRPSTKIEHAFMVLTRLRRIHTAKIWMGKDKWRVNFSHGCEVSAWAETLPLAICRAADALSVAWALGRIRHNVG